MSVPLTPSTWMRVSSILDEVLERPEAEWAALIDQRCTTPGVREHVLRMLAAHRATPGFLSPSAAAFARFFDGEPDAEEDLDAPPPATVGPWTIVREIGRGGMGVVYLAERTGEQFRQLAALKVVRAAAGSDQLIARFRRERQILASLNHPHIARLLDGGRAADGSPYLAMEYVEGRPLTAFCRERGMTLEERLRLMVRICDAVQHAHSRLVVHRDLKPSNILVTDESEPRLLDFGIAKLLAEDHETATLTRTGLPLMTPEYAAPEQLHGDPVSTATDVYALGLILYELVAGERPARQPAPVRPSLAVKDRALRRRLTGDLDTIVMVALRDESSRRYASAEALARDIERYLDGQPVSARADTVLYRAQKFASRHRWGVVSSTAAVIVLIAFAATMAAQARRTARQRDRAERVSQFLVNLFTVSSPLTQGGNVTAREILDRGAQRIETELAAEPEVQGHLMYTMGQVYWAIGLMGRAEQLFSRAVEVQRNALGPDDPHTLVSMNALGNTLVREGRLEAGVGIFSDTLGRQRRALSVNAPETLQTMNDLAYWLGVLGRYAEAEQLHREALDARRRRGEHGYTVWSMTDLGAILMRQGRYAEAERLTTEALQTWYAIKVPGTKDLFNEALLKGNVAAVYQRRRRYAEAEKYFLESAAVIERVLGPENSHTLDAKRDLAAFYAVTGRYEASETLLLKTLEMNRRLAGVQHMETLLSAYWLAVVYSETGRLEEAAALQTETLSLQRQTLGPAHPDALRSMVNLARIHARRRQFDEAVALADEALRVQRHTLGRNNPDAAESLYALACISALRDRHDEALALLRQAVESGYVDPARLARDEDLRSLRRDPELERLVTLARRAAS